MTEQQEREEFENWLDLRVCTYDTQGNRTIVREEVIDLWKQLHTAQKELEEVRQTLDNCHEVAENRKAELSDLRSKVKRYAEALCIIDGGIESSGAIISMTTKEWETYETIVLLAQKEGKDT